MKPSAILPAFVSGTLAGAGVYGIFLPNDAKGYVTVIFAFLLTAFWVAAGLSLRASANEIPTGGKAAFPELGATWIVAARESIRKRVAGGLRVAYQSRLPSKWWTSSAPERPSVGRLQPRRCTSAWPEP